MQMQVNPDFARYSDPTCIQEALLLLEGSTSHLSAVDQILFERFGVGPAVKPPHPCIHHAIEERAANNPTLAAVEHLGESLNYKDLNRAANHLAIHLSRRGVCPGDRVGLFLQRSIPMVIGILAILKLGAAYVPQDICVTPPGQLGHIVEIASIKVVLTLSRFRHLVPSRDEHVCVAIDDVMQDFQVDASAALPNPAVAVTPETCCFVLFTSGTTGLPNGVQVTHGNVCNILLTDPGSLGMRPGLKVGQFLNIAFDMAAWEILGCLANGATLVVRGNDFQAAAEQVDVIIATPSILAALDVDRCHNVKIVAVAGEPCPRPLADRWAAFCAFYNSCGPTETTIINTAQRYTGSSRQLTIGKPTPNNTVYILDDDRRPKPIGEVGEMWAGGDCVTAGYIGNAALTVERYAPDPFLGGGRMMFRTRDLGRWTTDGELEHLGRVDDQVKVRGFRVELDCVSLAIEKVAGCRQAVTLKLDARNLVAFVCPGAVDTELVRRQVGETLPYYCVPLFAIALDTFPMTTRGKVDKRRLMEIAIDHLRVRDGVAADRRHYA